MVFPEGRLGMGDRVNPFFPGIFDTARQYGFCSVQSNSTGRRGGHLARGHGRTIEAAVWRLAKSRGRIYVDIFPVGHVEATPDDDPKQLARAARLAIAQVGPAGTRAALMPTWRNPISATKKGQRWNPSPTFFWSGSEKDSNLRPLQPHWRATKLRYAPTPDRKYSMRAEAAPQIVGRRERV
ncbi:MAG: hypothetical protein R3A10_02655 [Caldilineaceae bacterium]